MTQAVDILDDDAGFRESLAFLLSAHGFAVTTHSDPSAFLQTVSGRGPDCLVCDSRMPGLSGLEVIRALRAQGATTPVILITGHAEAPLLDSAAEAGATLVLEKPFPPQSLIHALNQLLA